MIQSARLVGIVALLILGTAASGQNAFYLKHNDRVVFYGDSITDQRLYTTFVETFAVTRFPDRKFTFIHSGWGGDRVTGGGGGDINLRLDRDVFAYKPTVVTIMLGMNDASYRAFDENIFSTYSTGYQHIVERIKKEAPNARVTLIQPSPFDDVTRPPTFPGGYNAVLVRYGGYLKELAQRSGLDTADLNTYMVDAVKRAFEADPINAVKLNQDRVHPGPGGQLLMAAALLKAWNAPAIVSSVEITAGTPLVVHNRNTYITGIRQKDGALSWQQEDEALPFPIDLKDPVTALAVRSSDVVQSLNQQPLVVKGLTAPRYTLKIDTEEVGSFTKEQLAAGINLATLETPMAKQAMEVHRLTLKHNNVHFVRWRVVQVPYQNEKTPALKSAMQGLDDLEAEFVKQQRETAKPKPRRYELIPS